jgi:hypothetical protein
MRGPRVAVGVCGVGGIFVQLLGEEEKVRSHGQGITEGDTAGDVEEWLIGALDGGG